MQENYAAETADDYPPLVLFRKAFGSRRDARKPKRTIRSASGVAKKLGCGITGNKIFHSKDGGAEHLLICFNKTNDKILSTILVLRGRKIRRYVNAFTSERERERQTERQREKVNKNKKLIAKKVFLSFRKIITPKI